MPVVDIVLIAAVVGVAAFGARRIYLEVVGKKSCCSGGSTSSVKAKGPKDRDISHYPYSESFNVFGMNCAACAKTVKAALESTGVLAEVDLASAKAEVHSKEPVNFDVLKKTVHASGYRLAQN